ncbi:MAG: methyltransferase domain-containing protein [Pseudomonadota bacterium]
MQKCFDRYVWGSHLIERKGAKVLDVGGADVNGSYSELFPKKTFQYLGVDLNSGPGISMILDDPNRFPLQDKSIDLVISGQMLEHCANFWLVFTEMVRVVKDDGYIFLIAPSAGPIHRYPVDCYRFYPDSFQALADYAGCHLIDCWRDQRGPWKDLVGVFSRTPQPRVARSSRVYPFADQYNAVQASRDTETDIEDGATLGRLQALQHLHNQLRPENYLELGVRDGASLALATCSAVGVAPVSDVSADLGRQTKIVTEASDQFFEDGSDPILKAQPDLVLLDGMHLLENALRDFMQAEQICHDSSLIVIDGILPCTPSDAARKANKETKNWTGDVWKLIGLLKTWRPDLRLDLLDVEPSGLLLVSKLNPKSRVLWEQYNPLTRKMANSDFGAPPPDILARENAIFLSDDSISELLETLKAKKPEASVSIANNHQAPSGTSISQSKPKISVVVISYNMKRELPRTLQTLSASNQGFDDEDDVEIILVDNGSTDGIDLQALQNDMPSLKVHAFDSGSSSPVEAINFGLAKARAGLQGVMIDGARMASPGLLSTAIEAASLHPRAVIGTIAFHLGPKVQMQSVLEGYNQDVEDELLSGIDWLQDGYRLFDISCLAGSSAKGWLSVPAETNALFMKKDLWAELGGYDPIFQSPGGGYVNLDTWKRACELSEAQVIMLLGEATFHQVHGGVATNAVVPAGEKRPGQIFKEEYRMFRGRDYAPPKVSALFHGRFGGRKPPSSTPDD